MGKAFLEKGVKNCLIVIPEDASLVEKTAAEELSEYIEKSLAVKLDIVSENKSEGKCIFVGQTEYAKKAGVLGKSKENWIIKMVDGNLILTGGEKKMDRGIIYATYHFLEDIVGVRWWSPFEEDVLSLSELSLDDDLFVEGTPVMEYRNPYMHASVGDFGNAYLARTRTNVYDEEIGGVYKTEVRKYGDFKHIGRPGDAHTATKYFPQKEYFEKHPEWFAWNKVEGKRIDDGGFCLCNKEFREAFLSKLMGFIEEDVKLAEETGAEVPSYYSISPADLYEDSFCQCDECSEVIAKSGYSGYLIQFVNWIATEVGKKYPFISFEYPPYLTFIEPPKDDTLPLPNLIARIAHLRGDVFHGITKKSNELYLHYIKKWSEVVKKSGSRLYIWDYLYNARLNYPAPLYMRLKDTIKTFHDCGGSGVFFETQGAGETMWELNKFMLTHLLEDPDLDEVALEKDFMMRYYGEAGKCVLEYMDLIREKSEKYMLRTYCTRESSPFNYVDYDMAIRGTEILEAAKAATAGKEPYAERISWLQKPMDTAILLKFCDLKRMAESDGVKFDFDREKVRKRLLAALDRHAALPQFEGKNAGFISQREYFETCTIGEGREFDIPEELRSENPDDIYQFHMTDMIDIVTQSFCRAYGAEVVEDEKASCGRALKLNPDKAIPILGMRTMRPTSKFAENKRYMDVFIRHNDTPTENLCMYSEDFPYGDYKLLKIGRAKGLMDKNDIRAAVMWEWEFNVNLSGIAVNFPMNECDVYISMRSTGDVYGGKKGEENAFYMDRLIVVRK